MFSSDCKTLRLNGLDWSSFAGVTAVELQIKKGCNCPDDAIITHELFPTDSVGVAINSATLDSTHFNQDADEAIADGVYNITLVVSYGESSTFEDSICEVADCTISCDLATNLASDDVKDDYKDKIIQLHESILRLAACDFCTAACEKFEELQELLSTDLTCIPCSKK